MKILGQTIIILLVLLLITYISISHIVKPGYFSMHDDTQVARVIAMGNALRNDQFPVRWVSGLGYGFGYPIFNFYGPLPYYIGGILYSAGIDALVSTKIMFLAGVFLSGLVMYKVVREILDIPSGFVAATMYLYAPYHAVQIYIRGSVGEYYTLVFLPFIVLSIWRMFIHSSKSYFFPGAFGLAGVILSHTIFGYITTIFIVAFIALYGLFQILKKNTSALKLPVANILFGGLALSAFFWIPAVYEMGYTNVSSQVSEGANFRDHFVCLSQLWNSAWGFGGSAPGCIYDGISFKLGKIHIITSVSVLFLWFLKKKKRFNEQFLLIVGIITTLTALFFVTYGSKFLWDIIPKFEYIQYPWRFLGVANLGMSFLAGLFCFIIPRGIYRNTFSVIFIIFILFTYGKLFVPQYSYEIYSKDLENTNDISWRASNISNEYLPKNFVPPKSVDEIALSTLPKNDNWDSMAEFESETYSRFKVESRSESEMIIQRVYFPGWVYKVNGKLQKPKLYNGLPIVRIEEGVNVLELIFQDTTVRTFANIISLITTGSVLYFYYGRKTVT